ncbi:chaperone NapD [Motiliproteus sediminis]|uniref:chaperone NapD n=1 Tax=Motiliproteus sediminis TaxID=1468178 RepID=UPI001AEFA66A|nr:chaperone NapD [Motiliproteus sediminis]
MNLQSKPDSFDITGVVVRALPARLAAIREQLHQLRGVEVHAVNDTGQMVVTIEELNGEKLALDTLSSINKIPGVLSTSMVYHHAEQESH